MTSRLCGKEIQTQTNSKQREVRIKGKASVTTGHKQPPWGPTSLLFNGYRRPFPWRQSDRSSTLTIQFHPVPKIKIDCLEVNFHKKAKARGETKACCPSFAFKQINVLGMNPDTSTGADTQERIIITCCQNVNTQFQYIIIVYYCNHTTYLRIHSWIKSGHANIMRSRYRFVRARQSVCQSLFVSL